MRQKISEQHALRDEKDRLRSFALASFLTSAAMITGVWAATHPEQAMEILETIDTRCDAFFTAVAESFKSADAPKP